MKIDSMIYLMILIMYNKYYSINIYIKNYINKLTKVNCTEKLKK